KAAALGFDPKYPRRHDVPFLNHRPRMDQVPVAQLAHVNKSFDSVVEPDKCAKRCQPGDATGDERPDGVTLRRGRPGLGLRASQAKRYLPPLAIDPQDQYVDLVADRHDLGRMPDLVPGELRKVD